MRLSYCLWPRNQSRAIKFRLPIDFSPSFATKWPIRFDGMLTESLKPFVDNQRPRVVFSTHWTASSSLINLLRFSLSTNTHFCIKWQLQAFVQKRERTWAEKWSSSFIKLWNCRAYTRERALGMELVRWSVTKRTFMLILCVAGCKSPRLVRTCRWRNRAQPKCVNSFS